MKDIHGDLIRRGDLVCADGHTGKTIYYVKDCRTTLEDEVFDVCRITKDYHIERSDVEEDIEILKQAEEEFWQKVLKRQQPNLILPEI